MNLQDTNSIVAAAMSLGVNKDLLAAVVPALRNGGEGGAMAAIVKDLNGTHASYKEAVKRAELAEEMIADAVALATLVGEILNRMRQQDSGKAFIAGVDGQGEATPNYAVVHEAERKFAGLIEKKARLRLKN